MSVTIHIPTALRSFAGGAGSVSVEGNTVREALDALTTVHSGLAKHLRDGEGELRSFVNVYLGDEDIRYLDKEETTLQAGDALMIVPSIAGGLS